ERLDAAAAWRRPRPHLARQPPRRFRPAGALCHSGRGGAWAAVERGDRCQSQRAGHSRPREQGVSAMSELLQVKNLSIRFATPGGHIDAVKNLSFRMRRASTVALVGESGSGKSTVSQAILRILPRNGSIPSGEILFDDPRGQAGPVDLVKLAADGAQMRSL